MHQNYSLIYVKNSQLSLVAWLASIFHRQMEIVLQLFETLKKIFLFRSVNSRIFALSRIRNTSNLILCLVRQTTCTWNIVSYLFICVVDNLSILCIFLSPLQSCSDSNLVSVFSIYCVFISLLFYLTFFIHRFLIIVSPEFFIISLFQNHFC